MTQANGGERTMAPEGGLSGSSGSAAEDPAGRLPRAVRQSVAEARQVRPLVVQLQREIPAWRATSVRLLAQIWKSDDPQARQAICDRASELMETVEQRLAELAAVRGGLPPNLADHSRMIDTERALASLAAELERCRSLALSQVSGNGRTPQPF